MAVAVLRVDVTTLLPRLRSELIALLADLTMDAWQAPTSCPGWSVHGVACHLLGVEIGNVSVRRDGWMLSPGADADADDWLNHFNQQWVDACRRVSPPMLIELLAVAARRFEEHAASVDLDALAGPVEWATGRQPAPVWLDIAREYMERYAHQHQIREAARRPMLGAPFVEPVLAAAAHALPMALRNVKRPAGSVVSFAAGGEGGGEWYVVRTGDRWELAASKPRQSPSCELRTTVDGAIKLYVRDPSAPPPTWRGDGELAEAVSRVKAVLG
jgi:uncharacterized protein (TIGR03083 family)